MHLSYHLYVHRSIHQHSAVDDIQFVIGVYPNWTFRQIVGAIIADLKNNELLRGWRHLSHFVPDSSEVIAHLRIAPALRKSRDRSAESPSIITHAKAILRGNTPSRIVSLEESVLQLHSDYVWQQSIDCLFILVIPADDGSQTQSPRSLSVPHSFPENVTVSTDSTISPSMQIVDDIDDDHSPRNWNTHRHSERGERTSEIMSSVSNQNLSDRQQERRTTRRTRKDENTKKKNKKRKRDKSIHREPDRSITTNSINNDHNHNRNRNYNRNHNRRIIHRDRPQSGDDNEESSNSDDQSDNSDGSNDEESNCSDFDIHETGILEETEAFYPPSKRRRIDPENARNRLSHRIRPERIPQSLTRRNRKNRSTTSNRNGVRRNRQKPSHTVILLDVSRSMNMVMTYQRSVEFYLFDLQICTFSLHFD